MQTLTPSPPDADIPRGKVLVVDDTPANLVAMRRLLSRMDCDIVEVGSGNAALAACLEQEFALILLDVQMPEMDGFEVASYLSEDPLTGGVPIIFVTAAFNSDRNRIQGYEVGAVDYIAKPIDEFILLSKVKVFLELYRSRHALRAAEARARHQATHDMLTGLANRLLFNDRLELGLARARREGTMVALIYIDIDHFKPVNDRHGHQAGDALLKAIAQRMLPLFRASDTVARLGGDEFAVILDGFDNRADIDARCAKLLAELTRPFTLQLNTSIEAQVGASLGVAAFPDDATDAEQLIRQADARMYSTKLSRKGG